MAPSCPALKIATVAMLVLFAGQLLAATPAYGRVLPAAAAGRSLLEEKKPCVGACELGCRLFCKARCVLQADGSQKCSDFCFNDCV